jgi:hypothetical protein
MANTTTKLTWLIYILKDLYISLLSPLVLCCNNINVLYMTTNPVFHAWSKHIELDYHFVCEWVELGFVVIKQVSSNKQVADIYIYIYIHTKLVPRLLLHIFATNCAFNPSLVCGGVLATYNLILAPIVWVYGVIRSPTNYGVIKMIILVITQF